MNDQNPRQIAAQILGRRAPDQFTESLLEEAFARTSLSSADRGLCHEMVYGVVRRQETLDWLIQRKSQRPEQKAALQNLLRLGLYQIFWLDKIPAHAAVHETVETAKRLGYGPQAGFVNAVLRGYLRESDETRKLLEKLKSTDPAIGFSHPKWLVEKWQKRFGAEKTRQLLEWNNQPPTIYARVNTLKTDAGKLLETWRMEDVEYDFVRGDWLSENLAFELKKHPPLTFLKTFNDGWFYIQDPSTLLAPLALDPKPGDAILDFCAAPGGKTTFLAQLTDNECLITACDVSGERLKLIQDNCTRLGVNCVDLIERSIFDTQQLTFNKILVDAPCSNTGVMRRRVDLRWRISPEEITRLRHMQLKLLETAAAKLKPGGVLVYSTCSLEPEENTEVVNEFLAAHKDFKLESQQELLPFVDGVDGAFVAQLKK